jgi:hypothetical protein
MRGQHIRLIATLICIPVIFAFSACASTGVFVGDSPIAKAGPPPHAPAYGYRAKHTYYYYPDSYVYFDVMKNVYFYYDGGDWRMSVSLPNELRLGLGEHVTLNMDTNKPYAYFKQHKQAYPPGQAKKKHKHGKKW